MGEGLAVEAARLRPISGTHRPDSCPLSTHTVARTWHPHAYFIQTVIINKRNLKESSDVIRFQT